MLNTITLQESLDECRRLSSLLEQTQRENRELRAALQRIYRDPYTTCACADIAREALKTTNQQP